MLNHSISHCWTLYSSTLWSGLCSFSRFLNHHMQVLHQQSSYIQINIHSTPSNLWSLHEFCYSSKACKCLARYPSSLPFRRMKTSLTYLFQSYICKGRKRGYLPANFHRSDMRFPNIHFQMPTTIYTPKSILHSLIFSSSPLHPLFFSLPMQHYNSTGKGFIQIMNIAFLPAISH